jgi:xanthine dehydrogenase YagT iron-sulfur-binding subunit
MSKPMSSDGEAPQRGEPAPGGVSRRRFLESAGTVAATLSAPLAQAQAQDQPVASPSLPTAAFAPSGTTRTVSLHINGVRHDLQIEPRVTLLDALREQLAFTGTKKGCDRGQCGACTVLVDGRRINSCLTLAVMHEGSEITTIEGLGTPEALHPMQAAFIERDAFQCGYCTPGQICSAVALVGELKAGTLSAASFDVPRDGSALTAERMKTIPISDAEIRERMSGNICRCAAYPNIVAAIKQTAGLPT